MSEDKVIDLQHYQLKNWQEKYDALVDYCRENMSVQTRVHEAVLRLIKAKDLEQLLEIISVDFLSIFDLDVVRLAMESEIAFDTSYGEQDYSGFVFIPVGTTEAIFGTQKNVVLIGDCISNPPSSFEYIFADCNKQIASCSLLRLETKATGKHIILSLGVRHKERFHVRNGAEPLHFLAKIVSNQLDKYLDDLIL